MKFLKNIAKSLFGSSRSSKPKAVRRAKSKKSVRTAKPVKKKPVKKAAPKRSAKPVKAKKGAKNPSGQPRLVKTALAALPVAEVTHYFPHVNAAVLKIKTGMIRIGDELRFKGHTTDFKQKITSMQIDHKPVLIARKGDDFGVEVKSRVRAGDLVFRK